MTSAFTSDSERTVDDILLFDQVLVKRLQEARFHNQTPAVGLHTAALHLQLLQQGAPPPLSCHKHTHAHTLISFSYVAHSLWLQRNPVSGPEISLWRLLLGED